MLLSRQEPLFIGPGPQYNCGRQWNVISLKNLSPKISFIIQLSCSGPSLSGKLHHHTHCYIVHVGTAVYNYS